MVGLHRERNIGSYVLLGGLTVGHLINDFYGLVLPFLLPVLIDEFRLSFLEAGILAAATTILSGILQPALGYLADRNALRKRLIVAGFLAFGLGLSLMNLSTSYAGLLMACFIYGLGEGTFHPQSTNFITRTFPESRGWAMGIHGLGGSIGNFSAPVVVTLLIAAFGWRESAYLLAIPSVLVMALLASILTEPEKVQLGGQEVGVTWSVLLLALNFGMVLMLYKGFLTFLPKFLIDTGSSINEAGLISSLMLLAGLLTQPIGGMMYDKFGGRTVFIGCSILSGGALWLFTLSSGFASVLFTLLIGASISALFPVALAMASEMSNGGNVGLNVGLVFGISGTLSALTPIFSGYTADIFNLTLSFRLLIGLAMLATVIAIFLPRGVKSKAT